MNDMYEIGIVGAKNSGKTTLLESLIPALAAQGIKTATIKHTQHAHRFDPEGKDSFRHRRAGSVATIAISEVETALFAGRDDRLFDRLRETLSEFCDICLVEGDKGNRRPKILLTRNLENTEGKIPDNIVASYGDSQFREDTPHFVTAQIDALADFIIKESGKSRSERSAYAK